MEGGDSGRSHRLATEDELYEGVLSSDARRRKRRTTANRNRESAIEERDASPTASNGRGLSSKDKGKLEGWRSYLLDAEVALRGLVMDGLEVRPTADRIQRVVRLFDSFTKGAAPAIQDILKMFRVEFVRAIYDTTSLTDVGGNPNQVSPEGDDVNVNTLPAYFELAETLRREKAVLSAELDVIEAESSVEDLKRQIIKLQALVPFYENELERLGRENRQLSDEVKRADANLDMASEQHQKAATALDDELQRVTRENRELRLSLQRYQKQEDKYGAKATMIEYNHLKSTKTAQLQVLFESGSQEASLLLLLHQLEGLLNTTLTETDDQYNQCERAEVPTIRHRLLQRTTLVLEEMHEVERRYLRLSETGTLGTRTLLNTLREVAGDRCALLLATTTLPERRRDEALQTDSGAADASIASKREILQKCTTSTSPDKFGVSTYSLADKHVRPAECAVPLNDAAKSKLLWVRDAFQPLELQGDYEPLAPHADPAAVFNKRVSAPLMDISASKFLGGVELFTSGQLEPPAYLQTVNYVDPQHTIELPPKATHVSFKFPNPLRKEVRTRYGHQLLGLGDKPGDLYGSIAQRNQVLEWLREHGPLLEDAASAPAETQDMGDVGPQVVDAFNRITVPHEGERGAPHATTMKGLHWTEYKRVFGEFRPFLPRLLPVPAIDTLMLNAFVKLNERIVRRYELCIDSASTKSTSAQTTKMIAERYFRERFRKEDLQVSLMEVLEGRYVRPELVVKVMYELLASMETHASTDRSHTQAYLDCLAMGGNGDAEGTAAAGSATPAFGHLLALWMQKLSDFWPGTSVSAHVPLDEKETISLLRALYNLTAGTMKFELDDMVGDLLFSTGNNVSKALAREFFANGVDTLSETMLKLLNNSLEAKSAAVQWAELDYDDHLACMKALLCDSHVSYPLHLYTCCMMNKAARLPPRELAYIASLQILQGNGRSVYQGL